MKTPMSEKSPEMIEAIEGLFPGTKDAISSNRCPLCRELVGAFRDRLSEREYEISGICQTCQDEIFAGGE